MTNKLVYFVGNWKMFGDFSSIKILKNLNKFSLKFKKPRNRYKVIICVPNTLIHFFSTKYKLKNILLGGQNCHQGYSNGPFTGSVSASMLKKAGAKYVILGHSDNRAEGDSPKIIQQKIHSSLSRNLNVIFCIGENLSEKRKNKTFSILKKQIQGSIYKLKKNNKIIFAYEPIWSIGTGLVPQKSHLKKIFKFLKNEIKKKYKLNKFPTILYGGSVTDSNIRSFSSISEIDGFLIGGASLSSKKFIDIIKNYYK